MEEKNKSIKSIIIEGQKYYTNFTKKFQERKMWSAPNPKILKAEIPGNIIDIYAKENQQYEQGDVLLRLEAMKMINSVLMPFKGTIKKVHIKQGDLITKNQTLIEIH